MKKIITIIFMTIILINPINASVQTYYSDYSNYGDYILNPPNKTELIDVKEVTMYKYYKEEKELGDYYLINKNNSAYPYLDPLDFIVTNYTDYTEVKPDNELGRNIKTQPVYYYQDLKKIRYIHFNNFLGYRDELNINEIVVTANGETIPYTTYCLGCSANIPEKINNGNIKCENSFVYFVGYIRLDLGGYYNLSDLTVKIYLTDFGSFEKRYTISTSREESLESNIYTSFATTLNFKHSNYDEYIGVEHKLGDFELISPEWGASQKSYTPVIETKTRKVKIKEEYSYQDTMFRYYNIINTYADGYYEYSPIGFPIRDEQSKVNYYQIRNRDKVAVKSKIIINDKNQKLEDFIIENTTNNFIINDTVNYEKNGVYDVSYTFPFITIDKLVYVNIAENESIDNPSNNEADPNSNEDPSSNNPINNDEEEPNDLSNHENGNENENKDKDENNNEADPNSNEDSNPNNPINNDEEEPDDLSNHENGNENENKDKDEDENNNEADPNSNEDPNPNNPINNDEEEPDDSSNHENGNENENKDKDEDENNNEADPNSNENPNPNNPINNDEEELDDSSNHENENENENKDKDEDDDGHETGNKNNDKDNNEGTAIYNKKASDNNQLQPDNVIINNKENEEQKKKDFILKIDKSKDKILSSSSKIDSEIKEELEAIDFEEESIINSSKKKVKNKLSNKEKQVKMFKLDFVIISIFMLLIPLIGYYKKGLNKRSE